MSNSPTSGLDRALSVIGPTTLVTAALYYFGWARTRAVSNYFGIDPEMLGYSTADYVLRSVDTMLPVLVVAAVAFLVANAGLSRLIRSYDGDVRQVRSLGARLRLVGLVLLPVGVASLLTFPQLGEYPLVATIGLMLALAAVVLSRTGEWLKSASTLSEQGEVSSEPSGGWLARVATDVLGVAAIFGLIFLAASYVGENTARARANDLIDEPKVVLLSQHELHLLQQPEGVELTDHGQVSQNWRYRYNDLHLFAEADGRWFLLPSNWKQSKRVHVVEINDSVRIDIDDRTS